MTPDVNVLVAASRQDHPHHERALDWLEEAIASSSGRSLVILPMVVSGFLRLVTHPKVFVTPTPIHEALKFLRAVLDSPGVVLLSLGSEWVEFERLCAFHSLTGNAIPDAWIAAAASSNRLHLVTFDKDFRKLLKPGSVTVLKC
ncbi:TA system VapC family ribonuclease toxin [Ferrovum sp.]|uniref:TA system VapC family ribonuclease toxin n=1 Tax=Ferrovum sp. TaxID=2609467 RepID=UPI00262027B2|nr:TA system VapC family ribonuclease toxin [Ferrovum sp.]